MQQLKKRQEDARKQRRLFAKNVFLLGRETPIYFLQYLIMSFGGEFILQDEMPDDEKEHAKIMKKITHFCMDRPLSEDQKNEKGKEYVQPQYIIDSINNLFLLPTKPYTPGVPAPAHLSPFVDNAAEGYIPDRQREINALAGVDVEMMTGGRPLKATGAIGSESESEEKDDDDEDQNKIDRDDEDDSDEDSEDNEDK